ASDQPEATALYAAEPKPEPETVRDPEIAEPQWPGLSSPLPPVPNTDAPLLPPLDPVQPARLPVWAGRSLQSVKPTHLRPAIPLQPLLAPASANAILRVAIAREMPRGPIDTEALVRSIASRQAVRALPRMLVTTLRFGLQVLVDLGAGMEP